MSSNFSDKLTFETRAVHGYKGYDETTGAISFPIYQSATFRHPALYESTGYDYSRLQNPTREELEQTIASLEGGSKGFAFPTGMAAIDNLLRLLKAGDHIIVSDDLYGGTYRLLNEVYRCFGITATFVELSDFAAVEAAKQDNTAAIFIETPTNPLMKIADIAKLSAWAKENGLLTIVDNTFLTPYLQQPLALGADIVVHSGTKYLGGHNDTLCGLLVAKDEAIAERLTLIQKSTGAVLPPFDSWLILRGIKTLPIRMDKQQQNALKIAGWLLSHKRVKKVYYAGLPTHPGYEVNKQQAKGAGAMISFEVESPALVEQVLRRVKVILFAESLGGVETLITYPVVQTHSAIPEEIRNRLGINDKLLRISAGIENAQDLIDDLQQALED